MNAPEPHDPQSFVRALARGLAIMEALGGESRGRSASELAQQCSLDRATTRRILLTLMELGYVRSEDNRHFLTPRALSLGYAYLSSFPFWEVSRPIMARLVDEAKESCSAATLDGTHAVYVARIRSNPNIVDVNRAVGGRIPAYCTSLGRVLLAALAPHEQRERLLASNRAKNTETTVVDTEALMAILDGVRQQGYAVVDQELEAGLRSIAVPVIDAQQRTMAALNISVPAGRVPVDEMVARFLVPLRSAASELSRALRARDEG